MVYVFNFHIWDMLYQAPPRDKSVKSSELRAVFAGSDGHIMIILFLALPEEPAKQTDSVYVLASTDWVLFTGIMPADIGVKYFLEPVFINFS